MQQAIDTLFTNARSQNGWLDTSVADAQIKAIYDIAKVDEAF